MSAPLSLVSIPTRALRLFRREGVLGLAKALGRKSGILGEPKEDQSWIAEWTATPAELKEMAVASQSLVIKPLISIILPVFNTPANFLTECIESVISQVYPYWELCIADDASTNSATKEILKRYESNPKIKIVWRKENGHIAHASNSALELATGDYIALLDHDDTLSADALYHMAQKINEDPEVDLIYSNEDKIDISGERSEPTFKAAWSPEYFRCFMYIGHLCIYRRKLVESVGGFRAGTEGSQDYDLALRFIEQAKKVAHVPRILYHWRKHRESVAQSAYAKPYAFVAAKKALTDSLTRRNINATIQDSDRNGVCRITFAETDLADVALGIIGEENQNRALTQFIGSKPKKHILYANTRKELLNKLCGLDVERMVLIDQRVSPCSKTWFSSLLNPLTDQQVGMVGCKILQTGRERIFSYGYTLIAGRLGYNFAGRKRTDPGYAQRLVSQCNVSMLPSLCMAMRGDLLRDNLELLLKLESDPCFDVALGFIAQSKKFRVVVTPYAEVEVSAPAITMPMDLRLNGADYALLEEYFSVSKYVDPFYPIGLSIEQLDYAVGSKSGSKSGL